MGSDRSLGRRPTRRSVLRSVGFAGGLSVAGGAKVYGKDRSYADEDGDGIPDWKERSPAFHRRLESLFGADQFEGLDPERKDLLIDVRYVQGTEIFAETKRKIVDLFRERGIYAQWLDYPKEYDRERFEAEYGSNAREVLWSRDSFYRNEIEPFLRDVAIQLVVVPGRSRPGYEGLVYSPWMDALGGGLDGHVNGFSVGNRAVVADRSRRFEEARLVLHEITHYALCHDDDPANTGVMGTGEEIDLMDHEWEALRDDLDNVRDTTGYDVILRPCLWRETLESL